MTTVVNLPDDVAALLEERAAQRGVTVAELIRELAQLSANRQALEAFIGCVDAPVGRPFDIQQARADIADGLLREHDRLNTEFTLSPEDWEAWEALHDRPAQDLPELREFMAEPAPFFVD